MPGGFRQFRRHPEKHKVFQANWMAGSSPAMTVERKFSNIFMASSASGNIRVINSGKTYRIATMSPSYRLCIASLNFNFGWGRDLSGVFIRLARNQAAISSSGFGCQRLSQV
jgi:hypothetical protein